VLLEVAAQTLGHLVRSGGPMMADVVERQVRRWVWGCGWVGHRIDEGSACCWQVLCD